MTDTTTVEAEIVEEPTTHIARRDPTEGSGPPLSIFGTTDPAETIKAATHIAELLSSVIEERHLYRVMGYDSDGNERRHVVIEGWRLLGQMCGNVHPINEWTREIKDDVGNVLGWEARTVVKARGEDAVLSAAEAECRYAESNWENSESYALRSMAQTRADSKALRSLLDFVITLAGFNSTPAEEMDGVKKRGNGRGPAELSEYQCPACGNPVYDNRKSATGRQPKWRCSNNKCEGGKDGRPWASWKPSEFDAVIPTELPDDIERLESELLAEWGKDDRPEDYSYELVAKWYAGRIAQGFMGPAQLLFEAAVIETGVRRDEAIADDLWDVELAAFVTSVIYELVSGDKREDPVVREKEEPEDLGEAGAPF